MPKSDNFEQLKAAGCLANDGANLSDDEREVIDNLGKPEVDALIAIRKQLTDTQKANKAKKDGTRIEEVSLSSLDPLTPNIIL